MVCKKNINWVLKVYYGTLKSGEQKVRLNLIFDNIINDASEKDPVQILLSFDMR